MKYKIIFYQIQCKQNRQGFNKKNNSIKKEKKKGKNMEIKVGKWYLTRDDRKVFIYKKVNDDYYCMKGYFQGTSKEECSWSVEGSFYGESQHQFD